MPWLKRQFQRLNLCDIRLVPKLRKGRNYDVSSWPIATLPQEFISAMPPKADKPEPMRMTQLGTRSEDPYRHVFRLVYRRATLSPRDVARILLTRSTMTFMAAPRTSAQRAAFDTVSIAPSMSMPCATVPTTMTAARTI